MKTNFDVRTIIVLTRVSIVTVITTAVTDRMKITARQVWIHISLLSVGAAGHCRSSGLLSFVGSALYPSICCLSLCCLRSSRESFSVLSLSNPLYSRCKYSKTRREHFLAFPRSFLSIKLNKFVVLVVAASLNESQCIYFEEFTCSDGECIPRYVVCDGTPDCRSGEDEANCKCNEDEVCFAMHFLSNLFRSTAE